MVTSIEPAHGTDEQVWSGWLPTTGWPALDLDLLAARRVHVLAAHPDDEVLGAGGLLHLLGARGADVRLVWATDGEASHPGSTSPLVARLAPLRRAESVSAVAALGLTGAPRRYLGLPDGGLAANEGRLVDALRGEVAPDDVLLAPWSGDGHPDHEACGRAAAALGVPVVEYPVWTWSWSHPDDPRVPWHRARTVHLDPRARTAKASAVASFRTQVSRIGPGEADGPVLPARFLAHFARDVEVVFW